MFKLHREKANFTAAQEVCVEEGGYLANVLSEQKTNALSDLIGSVFAGRAKHAVYVGLHDSEMEGQYVNMRGSCPPVLQRDDELGVAFVERAALNFHEDSEDLRLETYINIILKIQQTNFTLYSWEIWSL